MAPTKGYYGLIQFCPDPARLECANVGVLLYCPEANFIDARLAPGNDRIRRFFGKDYPNFDYDRLNAAKRSIENRLKIERKNFGSLDDLLIFINTRANEVRISQPRPMKVIQPEDAIKELFAELVGGRPERTRQLPLFPKLADTFHQLQQQIPDRVYINKSVLVPSFGKLECDYGYFNGSLNWIRTQKFTGDNARIGEIASKLAMQGCFIRKNPAEQGMQQKLTVVSYIPDAGRADIESKIRPIFDEVNTDLITQDEIDEFAQHIYSEAH